MFEKDPNEGLSDSLSSLQEMRMGFGNSISLNIAQRAGCAIMEVFRKRFDAEEAQLFIQLLNPTTNLCVPFSALDAVSMTDDGWTDACRWIYGWRVLGTK